MQIQNNVASMNASRNHRTASGKLNKTLERLSSGYRINKAGDDAAGLTLSELMRSQIKGLEQAQNNVDDGINMTNVGEGALAEMHSMLARMKTLAVSAANETLDSVARENIQAERAELLLEMDRINQSTDFDGIPLFAELPRPDPLPLVEPPKPQGEIQLQVGATKDETMDVTRYYLGSHGLKLDDINLTTRKDANEAVDAIEKAIDAVTDVRAAFGSVYNHLVRTDSNLGITNENITAAESRIRDTDMADEITTFTKNNILSQASSSMMVHANDFPNSILSLIQG